MGPILWSKFMRRNDREMRQSANTRAALTTQQIGIVERRTDQQGQATH